jgi:hypothetical protein
MSLTFSSYIYLILNRLNLLNLYGDFNKNFKTFNEISKFYFIGDRGG